MSFFADLLGNASLAGGQMLEDDRNIREKEALVNRQAQLETERSIATEKRKMEMQEQQRQALQQRTQDQMDQAERGGQAIGEARDMGALDKARAMVPNEGQYAGKKITLGDVETIRANMSPEDAQKYYGIKPETTQTVLGDQLTAARAGGLHDAAGSLKTAYDETVKALQAQFKERSQQVRDDVMMRNSDTTAKNAETSARRVDAAIAKGGSSGGSDDKAVNLHSSYDNDQGYRVNIMKDGKHIIATDPSGSPITTDKFGQRVDKQANLLKKEGGPEYRKMPMEELRKQVAAQFRSSEVPKAAVPAPAAPGGKPGAKGATKVTVSNWN